MIYLKMPDGKEYSIEHTAQTSVRITDKKSGIKKTMFKRARVGFFIKNTIGIFIYRKILNDMAEDSNRSWQKLLDKATKLREEIICY